MTATPKGPSVSLLLPTRCATAALVTCLERIAETAAHRLTEVIVCVNGGPESQPVHSAALGFMQVLPFKVKVVRTPLGYSRALNGGLLRAKGDVIAVLQDDTLPAPGWLDELLYALYANQSNQPSIVAPLTNRGEALETLEHPAAEDPAATSVVAKLLTQRERATMPTGAMSGVCFAMRRAVYEAVGLFSEKYEPTAGHCVNDYLLRAEREGFAAAIVSRAFVFHYGGTTMDKVGLAFEGGNENLPKLMEVHRPAGTPTCAAAYVVEVPPNHDGMQKDFLASLKKTAELVDYIAIVNRCRESGLWSAIEEAGLAEKVIDYVEASPFGRPDLVRDRAVATNLARKTGADWILGLASGDQIDPSVTKAEFQALLKPASPLVRGYVLPIFGFWRGKTRIRADGDWGRLRAPALFKNLPAWGEIARSETGVVERIPDNFPTNALSHTMRLPLLSYNYARYEEIMPPPEELGLAMLPYRRSSMTLLLMGRPGEEADIYRQLASYGPLFTDFVFVDTAFKDDTVRKVVEAAGGRAFTYRCCDKAEEKDHVILCDYAAARNAAINHVQTEYIAFLDPDEEWTAESLGILPKIACQGVDGWLIPIENINRFGKDHTSYTTEGTRIFRKRPELQYAPEIHETLEESLLAHPELEVEKVKGLRLLHYGFLKTPPEERKARNHAYGEKLRARVEKNPTDAKSLFAYAVHLNSEGRYDEGDSLIWKSLQLAPDLFAARLEAVSRFIHRAYQLIESTDPRTIPDDGKGHVYAQMKETLARWVNRP